VLGPLVASYPGLVVPGAWNPFEVGVWAILSGAVPAVTACSRLSSPAWAPRYPGLPGGLTRTFPDPAAVTRTTWRRSRFRRPRRPR
jgi:3-methyladenine DNA glycosylase/8-oxoguanine DNA glycosylase